MAKFIVFYGNQIYGEYEKFPFKYLAPEIPDEVYQGAYIYRSVKYYDQHWFRMDGTPVLDEDVPKALKAYVLILNL